MSVELVILVAVLVLGVGAVLFWLFKQDRNESGRQIQEMARQIIEAQKQDQTLQFLQREVNALRDQIGKSLAESAKVVIESQKNVGERLDRATDVVGQVQKQLGLLDSSTRQVYSVGKDIAQLQEILRAPKMRGAIGELFLGDLLA